MNTATKVSRQELALEEAYELFKAAKELRQDLRWEQIAAVQNHNDVSKESEIREMLSFVLDYAIDAASKVSYSEPELMEMGILYQLSAPRNERKAQWYVESIKEITDEANLVII